MTRLRNGRESLAASCHSLLAVIHTPQGRACRERAALEWTEALTRIGDGHVPDAVDAAVREHFSEEEIVNLALAVVAINSWNRLAIAFRAEAGGYRPGMHSRARSAQQA